MGANEQFKRQFMDIKNLLFFTIFSPHQSSCFVIFFFFNFKPIWTKREKKKTSKHLNEINEKILNFHHTIDSNCDDSVQLNGNSTFKQFEELCRCFNCYWLFRNWSAHFVRLELILFNGQNDLDHFDCGNSFIRRLFLFVGIKHWTQVKFHCMLCNWITSEQWNG